MGEKDQGGKISLTALINKDKLVDTIMHVFTAEELNAATQHELFAISAENLDILANGNSPLSVPAKKTRFCKTVALTSFVVGMDAIDWDTEKVDMSK